MVLKMPILAGGLLAALLGIGSTAHAQSNVQLYGLVDAWTGVHKPVGGNKREGTVGGGGMTTSYWGLKGQEELSNVFAPCLPWKGSSGQRRVKRGGSMAIPCSLVVPM